MGLSAFVVRRILVAVPTFLVITIIIFSLMQLTPGSPLDFFLASNPELSYIDPQKVEILTKQLGLDKPVYVQYALWLDRLVHGNFGTSFSTGRPISEEIGARIGNTALLFLFSHSIGWLIAILVGVLSALIPDSFLDHAFRAFALAGIAAPAFWIGIMLILVFSVKLNLFPTGGSTNPNMVYGSIFAYLGMRIHYLILPSITIAMRSVAVVMRTMRAEMLDVLSRDYITTARAKGAGTWAVCMKHALRNSLLPVITLMGVSMGFVFGGAVLTETVFAWPGIGRYLVQSVYTRDYPAIMAVCVLISAMVLIANLLADITYALVNPRVRY